MSKPKLFLRLLVTASVLALGAQTLLAQTTTFTYQGKLTDAGSPANGVFDLQFKLFDALNAGGQQGATVTLEDVAVSSGVFTVQLDFGAAFPGAARFLEISVRPGASTGAFTLLTPRQPVNATPYAIRSLIAGTAAQANSLAGCVGCVTSDQIGSVNGSAVAGAIPVASVPAGNGNYVQNTTTQQASSNFNISGNGTAARTLSGNIVNATTQYNLNGVRVLANPGTSNLFAGAGAGVVNTTGSSNAFFGSGAGNFTTTGNGNAFFGASAGLSNTIGFNNSFFGSSAGNNSTGNANSFFGKDAGFANTTGGSNAFFGAGTGNSNISGNFNAFFGSGAGDNSNGASNTFIGGLAGGGNTTGAANTALGAFAEVGSTNSNATAIGYQASAACSNCVVLGSVNGVNGATSNANVGLGTVTPSERLHVVGNGLFTGNLTVSGTLTATLPSGSANYIQNTSSPQASSNFNISGNGTAGGTLSGNVVNVTTQYNIGGNRVLSNAGTANMFAGVGAGTANTTGTNNAFFGKDAGLSNNGNANAFFGNSAGRLNNLGGGNVFLGGAAGTNHTSGNNNTFVGFDAGFLQTTGANNTALGQSAEVGSGNTNATALGNQASADCSDCLVLGSINGVNGATADVHVGIGNSDPGAPLEITQQGTHPRTLSLSRYGSGEGVVLDMNQGRGTRSVSTATLANDNLFSISGSGHSGGGFAGTSVLIQAAAEENFSASNQGARLSFWTTPNGGTTEAERMRITNNGNIGIGIAAPFTRLHVVNSDGASGTIKVGSNAIWAAGQTRRVNFGDADNVYVGEEDADDLLALRGRLGIRFKALGTSLVAPETDNALVLGGPSNRWTAVHAVNGTIQTSDARLKRNVAPLGYGLRDLLKLRPVSFQWKNSADNHTYLGLIAQETADVIPEAVVKGESEATTLGMNYSSLIPVVIKSIQEQQALLAQKEQAIQALAAQNAALLKRLETVERALARKTPKTGKR